MPVRKTTGMLSRSAAEWLHERLSIPVVFLTGMADDATLLRSRGAEAFGYVLKPFGPEDLKASIELALNKNTVENELRRFEHWFSAAIKSIADAGITTRAGGMSYLRQSGGAAA